MNKQIIQLKFKYYQQTEISQFIVCHYDENSFNVACGLPLDVGRR